MLSGHAARVSKILNFLLINLKSWAVVLFGFAKWLAGWLARWTECEQWSHLSGRNYLPDKTFHAKQAVASSPPMVGHSIEECNPICSRAYRYRTRLGFIETFSEIKQISETKWHISERHRSDRQTDTNADTDADTATLNYSKMIK